MVVVTDYDELMIINIDYDNDHGFDDGDNDVTSSPPSSTDHLW